MPIKDDEGNILLSQSESPLRTSALTHAASTFTDHLCEQVLTPAPSLLMAPFHGDPSMPLRREISNTAIAPNASESPGTWEELCSQSSGIIIQM